MDFRYHVAWKLHSPWGISFGPVCKTCDNCASAGWGIDMRKRRLKGILLVLAISFAGSSAFAQAPAPIRLAVDLQEAPRRIFHVKLALPVKTGTQALLYPKWIPGEHAPDGPITDLVGLRFSAGGKTIPWRRDTVDMYKFYVEVPAGVDSLEADYDYLSPTTGEGY